MTPEMMPDASVEVESLPGTLQESATGGIDIEGYRQPAVTVQRKPGRQMTPEQRDAAVERLRMARDQRKSA